MKVTYFSLVWLFLLLTAEKAKQNNAFVSPTAPYGDGGGWGTGYRDHGHPHAHTAPQPSSSEASVLQGP